MLHVILHSYNGTVGEWFKNSKRLYAPYASWIKRFFTKSHHNWISPVEEANLSSIYQHIRITPRGVGEEGDVVSARGKIINRRVYIF